MYVPIVHVLVIYDEIVCRILCCNISLLGLVVRCVERVATFWAAAGLHASDEGCVQRLSRDNVQIYSTTYIYVAISNVDAGVLLPLSPSLPVSASP